MPPREVYIEDIVRDIECTQCRKPVAWGEKLYRGYGEIEVSPCECEYRAGYEEGIEKGYNDGYRNAERTYEDGYRDGFSKGLVSQRPTFPKQYFLAK